MSEIVQCSSRSQELASADLALLEKTPRDVWSAMKASREAEKVVGKTREKRSSSDAVVTQDVNSASSI